MGLGQDAAKYPPKHKTVPTTKNYPAQNANGAGVELDEIIEVRFWRYF